MRAQTMRAVGHSWTSIGRELDVLPTSLQRWVAKLQPGPLAPVVIDDELSQDKLEGSTGLIVLTTPDGYRLYLFALAPG